MEEGSKQGVTLYTPDSVPNASPIKSRCSQHMVYRQEEWTICQKQGGQWKRNKAKNNKEEILKKAELVINARNSFVYNHGAKGSLT